ncbi:MAG: cyclic nucleotide-binding domain-containing protein [Gammaproteobacteria bacterium]
MFQESDIDINLLKRFSPLDSLSNGNLNELSHHIKQLHVSKGKILFKRNQPNKDLFFLIEGSVDLLDEHFQAQHICAPSDQTQCALDTHEPHRLTAVTTSDVILLCLGKDRLDLVMTWDQAGGYLVEDIADKDALADHDWMSALLGSQLFQKVPPANLQQLFTKFTERSGTPGEAIVKEGEKGDTFFVIQKGLCKVTRLNDTGHVYELATLRPGQFFGEEALIGDTARNATVSMVSDGILMHLGKDDFKKLLEAPVVQYLRNAEFEALMASPEKVVLVDVRLPVEILPADRPSRLVIPLADLRTRISDFEADTTYVLTREGGRRSVLGAYLIHQFGFKAFVQK